MPVLPTDPKKIRSKISSYMLRLRKEQKEYGSITDGAGKRMILFWLHFLLNDLGAAKQYFDWYEDEFPDDMGEPIQHLCWALSLHRMGCDVEACNRLAIAMLSNAYMIPKILERSQPPAIRASSNYQLAEYVQDGPKEVFAAITTSDKTWLSAEFDSQKFIQLRKKHREIEEKLEVLPIGKERSQLVGELMSLLSAPLSVRLT